MGNRIIAYEISMRLCDRKQGNYTTFLRRRVLKYADLEYFDVNTQFVAVRWFFRIRFWRKSRADEIAIEIQCYCYSADNVSNIRY